MLELPVVHGAATDIPSIESILADGRYEPECVDPVEEVKASGIADALDGTVDPEGRIHIHCTGHGMIAPLGAARGAMDDSSPSGHVTTTPRVREDPYPGSGRLNTLTSS